MNHPIDIKSALIGLCLGVAAILGLGASSPTTGAVGRYQIAGTATHGMVIDTATGQVWTQYLQPDGIRDSRFYGSKNEEPK
jgi:DNA-binding transcriptional regulator YdaS (Cro superfamily)